MKYKLLGKTGLRVSEVCLGAMTFGNVRGWGSSEDNSRRVFDDFVSAGGNFIDTAPGYQDGESEALVAKFITGARDRFVIATKFSLGPVAGDPNSSGNGRKNMRRAVEQSLRRLATDYIDLYWMHAWDAITPEEEIIRGLDDLVREGKVLHIGFSDAPAWLIARSQTFAEVRGWTSLAAVQLRYCLLDRSPDRELLPMAAALGLSVLVWGGLGGGLLSGKYAMTDGVAVGEGRLTHASYRAQKIANPAIHVIAAIEDLAKRAGISPAQLALAWIKSRSPIMIPILGARTAEQLADNLGCLNIALGAAQLAELDRLSAVVDGFPQDFLQSEMMDKLLFGELRSRIEAKSRLSV